jgi:hypothetical protein
LVAQHSQNEKFCFRAIVTTQKLYELLPGKKAQSQQPTMSLIHHLQQVADYRTKPHYPLWVVMLLVIMGIMSGCTGYRALEGFVERHQSALLKLLELPYARLPSFTTLRRIMIRISFESLTAAFNAWAAEAFEVSAGEQLATDGKSIKASVRDYDKSYQDFMALLYLG